MEKGIQDKIIELLTLIDEVLFETMKYVLKL